jgi:hypothetical protein
MYTSFRPLRYKKGPKSQAFPVHNANDNFIVQVLQTYNINSSLNYQALLLFCFLKQHNYTKNNPLQAFIKTFYL